MSELEQLRGDIDAIDRQIVDLMKQRMETVAQVAEYKKANNIPVLDSGRERALLSKVGQEAGEELADYIQSMYRTILSASRSYQHDKLGLNSAVYDSIRRALEETPHLFPQRPTVACQGIEGAYSQIACDRLFKAPSILYFQSFDHVFKAVESGMCQYGILPIENSTAGSVNAVYDLMIRHNFSIVRSARLKVSHNLLAKHGTKLEDVKEVVSHTQALQQCSNFLKANPNIKVTIFENTATAAKYVAESGRTDLAALSSTDCAKLYGLHVLQDGVQNNENNYTRFICIAKNMEIYAGSNRISLMLSLDHRPGSLHEMIGKFACRGINLCKLESRPIPGKDFEFRFYFDLDGSVFSPETMTVLKDIEQAAESLSFLGCYSEV